MLARFLDLHLLLSVKVARRSIDQTARELSSEEYHLDDILDAVLFEVDLVPLFASASASSLIGTWTEFSREQR